MGLTETLRIKSLASLFDSRTSTPRGELECWFGASFQNLLNTGIISPSGGTDRTLCPSCKDHPVFLASDDTGEDLTYLCPEKGIGTVPATDYDRYIADPHALAAVIAAEFNLAPREMIPRTPNQLFQLGHIEENNQAYALFLVTAAPKSSDMDRILADLDDFSSQKTGLGLTLHDWPIRLRSKKAHRFVPVWEVLSLTDAGLCLDKISLRKWLRLNPAKVSKLDKGTEDHWRCVTLRARAALIASRQWDNSNKSGQVRSIKAWAKDRNIAVDWPSDKSIKREVAKLLIAEETQAA